MNLICQNLMSQNHQISAFCLQALWKIDQDKKLETCLSIKKIGRFQFYPVKDILAFFDWRSKVIDKATIKNGSDLQLKVVAFIVEDFPSNYQTHVTSMLIDTKKGIQF